MIMTYIGDRAYVTEVAMKSGTCGEAIADVRMLVPVFGPSANDVDEHRLARDIEGAVDDMLRREDYV